MQLKEKGETSNGKPEAAEELREAIFLAEETHPGICDSLVAELVQRLQRYCRFILSLLIIFLYVFFLLKQDVGTGHKTGYVKL